MTFARLRGADWVAMLVALSLLIVMAVDWYSTAEGDEARRIERTTEGDLRGEAGEDLRDYRRQARELAEGEERNAWQADGGIDRLILAVLLATVALALGAGFLRAARRRFEPPLTPTALAAIAAGLGALLVTYRIVQEPGFDESSTVKAGAPLALILLGALVLACSRALKNEEEGEPFRRLPERKPAEQKQPEPAA